MSCITTALPGYRFSPSDKDLVGYYLKMKIEGNDSKFRHIIPVIDLCKFEPADLPAFFKEPDSPDHDREWIFFVRPDRKHTNSNRCNRATEKGFYKITGNERDIQDRESKAVIGKKRTLTFYQGRMPGAKRTDWGLHELSLCKTETETGPNPHQQRDFVVCRLRDKSTNCTSGNKKLKDDLVCHGIADSGNVSYIALNSEDDRAAATDMVSDAVEHLPYEEPGECTESPNGSCLMNIVNDISTCDDEIFSNFDCQAANELFQEVGIADSGNVSYIALNSEDDRAAATDMISDAVEHLPYEEPGECTESPNGSCLMNIVNDISTCDDEIFSNFDCQAANERFQELLRALGESLDSPFPPPQPAHQPPQHQPSQQHQPPLPHQPPLSCQPSLPHLVPQSQGYCSSTMQSPLYMEPGIVPYVFGGDSSKQQCPIC